MLTDGKRNILSTYLLSAYLPFRHVGFVLRIYMLAMSQILKGFLKSSELSPVLITSNE